MGVANYYSARAKFLGNSGVNKHRVLLAVQEFDFGPEVNNLPSETVQGAALTLERIDNVHGGDGLATGVLSVGDGVTDYVLKEHLQHTAGLLVDKAADALDTASASQPADRGLGDALDVVSKDFAVSLSTTLAESLASFASASGHFVRKLSSNSKIEIFVLT